LTLIANPSPLLSLSASCQVDDNKQQHRRQLAKAIRSQVSVQVGLMSGWKVSTDEILCQPFRPSDVDHTYADRMVVFIDNIPMVIAAGIGLSHHRGIIHINAAD
jgi:hypothetical protein